MKELFQNWQLSVYNLGFIAGAVIIGIIVHFIIFRILRRLYQRTSNVLVGSLVKHISRPAKYLLILLAVNVIVSLITLSPDLSLILGNIFRSLFIAVVGWLIICLLSVSEEVILGRYDIKVKDNLSARKIHTQLKLIKRILTVVVLIVMVALILMGFEMFRQLGTGIIASAGLASLIIGLAAQKIFGNLLAGLQVAFTQPMRLDDVVIVENEWGWIEEITLTYVVVRIWDLRRLVLPMSYFTEKPFQNWTRVSANFLGTVFIYTDFTVPVKEVREELNRIAQNSDKWDGKVCGLQVTNATEHTMELRAIVSAADSSAAWDLRCEVREKLIEFIQRKYPDALPKMRAELQK